MAKEITILRFTPEEYLGSLNEAKEVLLKALEKEGKLKESAESLNGQYALLFHQKGWLGRTLDRVLGLTDDAKAYYFTLSKVIP